MLLLLRFFKNRLNYSLFQAESVVPVKSCYGVRVSMDFSRILSQDRMCRSQLVEIFNTLAGNHSENLYRP